MGSKATPQFQTPANTPLFTAPSIPNQPSVSNQLFPGPGSCKATISPPLKKIATLFSIRGTEYNVELKQSEWRNALQECIEYYSGQEKYEQCIEIKQLLDKL
jgi:hypothetical protein